MSRRTAVAGGLIVVAVGAAACGGGGSSGNGVASKSPSQALSQVRDASLKASSVHYQGTLTEQSMKLHVDMDAGAQGGQGTVGIGSGTAAIRALKRNLYFKGDTKFYELVAHAPSAATSLLAGKWLKVPASNSSFSGISKLTDVHELLSSALTPHGSLSKTGTTTVNGTKVVGLKDNSDGSVLYVSTTGKPYPVELKKPKQGSISFSKWNQPVHVTAPPHAVDLGALIGGG